MACSAADASAGAHIRDVVRICDGNIGDDGNFTILQLSIDRKTQTQNLGQLNPETKGKKYIFGPHFDTYPKMIKNRRNGFLNRSQNVVQKHFFNLGFWVGLP